MPSCLTFLHVSHASMSHMPSGVTCLWALLLEPSVTAGYFFANDYALIVDQVRRRKLRNQMERRLRLEQLSQQQSLLRTDVGAASSSGDSHHPHSYNRRSGVRLPVRLPCFMMTQEELLVYRLWMGSLSEEEQESVRSSQTCGNDRSDRSSCDNIDRWMDLIHLMDMINLHVITFIDGWISLAFVRTLLLHLTRLPYLDS